MKVSDLTPENQKIWKRAEEEIRAKYENTHRATTVIADNLKKIGI